MEIGVVMSIQDTMDAVSKFVAKHGFPVLASVAIGFVLRNDVLLPLVDAHETFLHELTLSQKELVQAMQEQTRLLYALQPRTASYRVQDDAPQN